MKLSNRLTTLKSLVQDDYTHIWDCCCDHGFLGIQLLAENKAPHIHFADIVPNLMSELEAKLTTYFPLDSISEPPASQWHTHCLDVATIPLDQPEPIATSIQVTKQLVIIAGVGGDLTQALVESIHQQHSDKEIDFLLCPVHQQFELRSRLVDLNFELLDEVLIEENGRFYEIILIRSHLSSEESQQEKKWVSPVGDKIWQQSSSQQQDIARRYKERTLAHYQRIHQGHIKQSKPSPVKDIIEAYQTVTLD